MTARVAGSAGASWPPGGERAQYLEAVYDLADAVSRAVPLEDLYEEAVRAVCAALEVRRAALLMCDEDGVMRFRAWRGLSDGYRAAAEGHSPWAPDEERPAPVVIEDLDADQSLGALRETVRAEGIGALAFVPLVADGRLLGKFMLYHDEPHSYSELELRLAATIAASVGIAIERRTMVEELRSSRDQLQAVFENVADGITVLDRQGRLVFANEAAARLCGFASVPEMLATLAAGIVGSFQLFDVDGAELAPEQLPDRRVLAGEPEAELLVRYRGRGFSGDRWSKVRATPIRDEHGVVRFAISVFRDVTEEHEEKLQEARLYDAERNARQGAERLAGVLGHLEAIANVGLQARSLDELLSGILGAVRDALGSDRATILLLDDDDLVMRASVGIDEETARTVRVALGEGVAGRIAATQSSWVVDDLSRVEVVSPYLRDSGSLAGVPLLFGGRLLGVLHVSSDAKGAFDPGDLEFLRMAAERVALGIEQTRMFERQHEIATVLQRSLLPERFARIPGVAIAAEYLPAADGARVGGDWYDAFPLGDGRVMVAVGDVVGHGVDAAAAMGQVRHALRAYARENPAPSDVFARLNGFLLDVAPRDFCTAFCAIVDPWAGAVAYVNAGHPPPIALGPSGEPRFLDDARSVPLGVTADCEFGEATDTLDPGSVLFAYTDGLVERRDQLLDERLELLAREVAEARGVPLRRLPEAMAAALLTDGSQADDVAMLAIQLASAETLSLRLPAEPTSLAVIRRALAGFLARAGASRDEIFELQVACGEACANVVEHAYGARLGFIRLQGSISDDTVSIGIRDTGTWKDPEHGRWQGRGHGLRLIRAFADEAEVRNQDPSGTEILIVRRLAAA